MKANETASEYGGMARDGNLDATQLTHTASAEVNTSVVISIFLMVGAEVVTSAVGVLAGVLLYCGLTIGFVTFAYLTRYNRARQIFLAFTLLPLLRILSVVLVIPRLLPYLQYALIGFPILVTALIISRTSHLRVLRSHLDETERIWQIAFAVIGIPLGVAAYLVLPSQAHLIYASSPLTTILVWVSLTLFGSVTEEIVFRGVIQKTLFPVYGSFSIIISSVLYASMFLGTLSLMTVVFYFIIGLLFGFWARATKSITGPILAHVLLNAIMLAFLTIL